MIDAFPPNQQPQIRVQLSMVLQAVVSQQLIPAKDGSVAPAFEIMKVNGAIRNMIRESKVHQIDTVIYSSAGEGMISMDASILELYRQGKISAEEAMTCAAAPLHWQRRWEYKYALPDGFRPAICYILSAAGPY